MPKYCFLDLDGVLVDLHSVIYAEQGITDANEQALWNNGKLILSDEQLWGNTDAEWWASLGWMRDGRDILEVVENYFEPENIFICTKPAPWPGSAEGKLQWIQRNIPKYSRQYIFTPNKWACANAETVLIDDSVENIEQFTARGGEGILVPRSWNSDEELPTIFWVSPSLHICESLRLLFDPSIAGTFL